MRSLAIAVRLKAPDPAASTALATMKRISADHAPGSLSRYDHWVFSGTEIDETAVRRIVEHFDDIVNPNKQSWSFLDPDRLPSQDDLPHPIGVLVTDREDSVSENWTSILGRRGFRVDRVVHSVLWVLGYPGDHGAGELRRMALELSLTTRREGGLLANPVSQKVSLIGSELT